MPDNACYVDINVLKTEMKQVNKTLDQLTEKIDNITAKLEENSKIHQELELKINEHDQALSLIKWVVGAVVVAVLGALMSWIF